MDYNTLGLVILSIFVIFLYLDQFNIVDIAPKCSGFNNLNDIEEVRNTLAKYKIMYKTDYDELVIRLVAQMPYDKRMAYYNKIAAKSESRGTLDKLAANSEDRGKLDKLAPPPLPEPELSIYNEMVKQKLEQERVREQEQVPEPAPAQKVDTTNWAGNKFSNNGRCGPKFKNTACPNNQCCSVYGWCGTTRAFCGNMMSKGQFNGERP